MHHQGIFVYENTSLTGVAPRTSVRPQQGTLVFVFNHRPFFRRNYPGFSGDEP